MSQMTSVRFLLGSGDIALLPTVSASTSAFYDAGVVAALLTCGIRVESSAAGEEGPR